MGHDQKDLHKFSVAGALVTLGIIFGDIGNFTALRDVGGYQHN
jgi:K+ transporter